MITHLDSHKPLHYAQMTSASDQDHKDHAIYLQPTFFIDFNNPEVIEFSSSMITAGASPKEIAVQLYYGVRDQIKYDPYDVQPNRLTMRASHVVKKHAGYCVAKAVLLTALLRLNNIPARLGLADVTNHLSTRKLREIMGTDLFIYHGYTEMLLTGKWVKATPAFNLTLCQRFHVQPLEFDGETDSLFHEYDTLGHRHMEYVHDHGHFADLPFERIFDGYERQYPGMFERFQRLKDKDFSQQAEQEQ